MGMWNSFPPSPCKLFLRNYMRYGSGDVLSYILISIFYHKRAKHSNLQNDPLDPSAITQYLVN